MSAPNAAMARWHDALQQEARTLCRRAAILRFRGFDLPPDWEIGLADAMRAHGSGVRSSAEFDGILPRAAALLSQEVRS